MCYLYMYFRLKQELSVQKEELRVLKRKDQEAETDIQRLQSELDTSRNKLDSLYKYEKTLEDLNEQNQSLHNNLSFLQDQCEHIAEERDELERQKRDIVEALNEEREVKSFLETKLQEDILRSPHRVSWLTESTANLSTPNTREERVPKDQVPVSASVPTSPTLMSAFQAHSTPLHSRQMVPSLFSEIQTSITNSTSLQADNQANAKVTELNAQLEAIEARNAELTGNLKDKSSEADKWKTRYKKLQEEKATELESMADEISAKKEISSQLNNQLNVANKEKKSHEIEIEGLREEMKRARETARMENEKLEKEFQEERSKCEDLHARVVELEEKLSVVISNGERMENILVNSRGELVAMVTEITNIHRAMKTLQRDELFTETEKLLNSISTNNETLTETYDLSVHEGKRKLKVLKENHTLEDVSKLKELLRQIRLPMEMFTKKMLERSLAQSSKLILPSSGEVSSSKENGAGLVNGDESTAKRVVELESNLNKIRARLANRTEEVNQLRAIMKARQTTVDVTVSSLKSKLEGQKRAHEAELNQHKHKVKTLRKERDDHISLGALTSRRCQEYLEEIGKGKRRFDELKGESDHLRSEHNLLSVYLERSIKQKLNISQELERYREQEERNRVIPLTLSSSRV